MKYAFIFAAMIGLVCGCRSAGHVDPGVLGRVSLGMTKQEVIASIGNPQSVSAERGIETLYYVEERPWWQWSKVQIKFVNGKVTSYGEVPPEASEKSKN